MENHNLVDQRQIEHMIAKNIGTLVVKLSPISPEKKVIEAKFPDLHEAGRSIVGFMSMFEERRIREYSGEQAAVNTIKRLMNKVGADKVDLKIEITS